MEDTGLLDAELNTTGFHVTDGLGDVKGNRANLGVGHQTARSEDATETTDDTHHVRGRDRGIEVHEAFLDPLREFVAANDIGAGLTGLALLLALGEDSNADGLAGAVGKNDRAADHLVSVAGIDTEVYGDIDSLVELSRGRLLYEFECRERRVGAQALDLRTGCVDTLALSAHGSVLLVTNDVDAHGARGTFNGTLCSFEDSVLRSVSFCLAMDSTCAAVSLPTLSRLGTAEPFESPSSLRISTEAGES